MRGKRELSVAKSALDKDMIKRYDDAILENERLACKSIDEFSASAKELLVLSKERSKKKREATRARRDELAVACENLRSRISWYLNVIGTSAASAASLAQRSSLKGAMKMRLAYGKKRVSLLEKYEKAEAEYSKAQSYMLPEEKVKVG